MVSRLFLTVCFFADLDNSIRSGWHGHRHLIGRDGRCSAWSQRRRDEHADWVELSNDQHVDRELRAHRDAAGRVPNYR